MSDLVPSILYFNPVGTLGGAERSLLDLLAGLRQTRPDWPLSLIMGGDGPLFAEAERLGVRTTIVRMPAALAAFGDSGLRWSGSGRALRAVEFTARALAAGATVPAYLLRLRRAINRICPQIVHSNGLKCHLLAGYAVPRGTPVVWHVRDFLTTRPAFGRVLRLARRPRLAIANSHATAEDTRQALPGVPVVTVYNGIDVDRFDVGPAEPDTLDRMAGLPAADAATVRVGLVATYARWKGQDVFLDAAVKVHASASVPVRFYVVGGPVYQTVGSQYSETELRELIASRGLTDCAGLVPFCQDLPPVYRSLDVVVHASTRPEPFGRTIVEAMACGRAVVVAKSGGAGELFTEGVDAVGVAPCDPAALAGAIRNLIDSPELRLKLGTLARQTAVSRFSRSTMVAQVVSAYDSVHDERISRSS